MPGGMGLGMGGMMPWDRMFQNGGMGSMSGNMPWGPGRGWGWGPSLRAGQMAAAQNPNPVAQAPKQAQGPVKADVGGIQQAQAKIAGDGERALATATKFAKQAAESLPSGVQPGAKTTKRSLFGNVLGKKAPLPGSWKGQGGGSKPSPVTHNQPNLLNGGGPSVTGRGSLAASGSAPAIPGLPSTPSPQVKAAGARLLHPGLATTVDMVLPKAAREALKGAGSTVSRAGSTTGRAAKAVGNTPMVGEGAPLKPKFSHYLDALLGARHVADPRNAPKPGPGTIIGPDMGPNRFMPATEYAQRLTAQRRVDKAVPWAIGGMGAAAGGAGIAGALLNKKGMDAMTQNPVFELAAQFAKQAAQDNSAPQRSATGESEGLTFNENEDDYFTGQKAWGATSKYLKHGAKAKEPNPFKGDHKGVEKKANLGAAAMGGIAGGLPLAFGLHGAANAPQGWGTQGAAHGYGRGVGAGLGAGVGMMGGGMAGAALGSGAEDPRLQAILALGGAGLGGVLGGVGGHQLAAKLMGKRPWERERERETEEEVQDTLTHDLMGKQGADVHPEYLRGVRDYMFGTSLNHQDGQVRDSESDKQWIAGQFQKWASFLRSQSQAEHEELGSEYDGITKVSYDLLNRYGETIGKIDSDRVHDGVQTATKIGGTLWCTSELEKIAKLNYLRDMEKSAEDAGLNDFQKAFFLRCAELGLDEQQVKQAVDKVHEKFGADASTELYLGMEKVANPRMGLIRSAGQKVTPYLDDAVRWFTGAGRKAAQKATPRLEQAAGAGASRMGGGGGAGRIINTRPFYGPGGQITHAQPSLSRYASQAIYNPNVRAAGGRAATGFFTGGFAEPQLTGSDDMWSWRGALGGAGMGLMGNRRGNPWQRQVHRWGVRPMQTSLMGGMAGSALDMTGLTQGYGRQTGAWLGAGMGSPMGRQGMMRALGPQGAAKVNRGMNNFVRGTWYGGMRPLTAPLGAAKRWGQSVLGMKPHAPGQWTKGLSGAGKTNLNSGMGALGKGVGMAGTGLALGSAGLGMGEQMIEGVKQEALQEAQAQAPAMMDAELQRMGTSREELAQLIQQGKAGGGMMQGVMGIADNILGMFGLPVQNMSPMQKMAILLGGGMMLGGGLGGMMGGGKGMGALGGLGGLMMLGGFAPMMFGGQGGQQQPGAEAAGPVPRDSSGQPLSRSPYVPPTRMTARDELALQRQGQGG